MSMERKSPVSLRVDDAFLDQTAEEEGFVAYAYDDADPKRIKTPITDDNAHLVKGTLTIGHGHTRTVVPGMQITPEQGKALLRSDVREAESCVHRYVRVPLTQGEFNGLVDLFFNVGPGRMRGSTGPDDPGRDGIACLGKSGGGRPSTLLTILNQPTDNDDHYERAATCFSQWRSPGSIYEWGLLKRRVRFMLMFMGLPIRRAVLAFPNSPPLDDRARYAFVQQCIRLGIEEKADADAMRPTLDLTPSMQAAPPPLATTKPDGKAEQPGMITPSPSSSAASAPKVSPAPTPPSPAKPSEAKPTATPAAPRTAPVPPPPPKPVVIAPERINPNALPTNADTVKNMADSTRMVGMVLVAIGSIIQVVTLRFGIGTAIGAVFFDLTRDPVVITLAVTAIVAALGWITKRNGKKTFAKGADQAQGNLY